MTQLSKYGELRRVYIRNPRSFFKIPVWTIFIGDRTYILIYGEKFSSNFFVNVWNLLTIGTYKEIEVIRFRHYISSTTTRFVFSWRAAKSFVKNLSSLKEN